MLFARYRSRLLVWLASLSLLVAFVGAMTVQFIGGARLLETAAGIPYETGLLIFGISIALYTAFGGFRASVLNDTLQGMVMLIGTIVLLVGPMLDTCTVFTMLSKFTAKNILAVYSAGLLYNVNHGIGTALTLLFVSKPLLAKLERLQTKYGILEI